MKGYSFLREREQKFNKERRVNKRYRYHNKVTIESVNLNKVNIEVLGVDLSISGIGFKSTTSFNVNDMLEIAFKYKKVTIPAIIKIQHVDLYDHGFYVGGQFIALQDSYREVLKDLV